MYKILLVEDEESIRKIIAYDLKKDGYSIYECSDGKEAMDVVEKESFDLIILDWMVPYINGIELIEKFRKRGIDSIIIMLTAKDDEADVLQAFEAGVDDYMSKPFSPRELLARIQAHLKRRNRKKEEKIQFHDIILDLKRREVLVNSEFITLTKKEFDLLEYFIRNHNIVLSRDDILNDIWGFEYDGDTRIVDVHVFKLRNKLLSSAVKISSSRGVGYIMEFKHEL